jgi:hypothetical protein
VISSLSGSEATTALLSVVQYEGVRGNIAMRAVRFWPSNHFILFPGERGRIKSYEQRKRCYQTCGGVPYETARTADERIQTCGGVPYETARIAVSTFKRVVVFHTKRLGQPMSAFKRVVVFHTKRLGQPMSAFKRVVVFHTKRLG